SWNHGTDDVWRQLDPELWESTHNPWVVLQTVSRDQIERVLANPVFRKRVAGLVQATRQAAKAPAWFQRHHADAPLTCAAYFSMEFMLSEALPIYSGGSVMWPVINSRPPAISVCRWSAWDCSTSRAIFVRSSTRAETNSPSSHITIT